MYSQCAPAVQCVLCDETGFATKPALRPIRQILRPAAYATVNRPAPGTGVHRRRKMSIYAGRRLRSLFRGLFRNLFRIMSAPPDGCENGLDSPGFLPVAPPVSSSPEQTSHKAAGIGQKTAISTRIRQTGSAEYDTVNRLVEGESLK